MVINLVLKYLMIIYKNFANDRAIMQISHLAAYQIYYAQKAFWQILWKSDKTTQHRERKQLWAPFAGVIMICPKKIGT